MSGYACPVCGSDNTQSFPAIYESGQFSSTVTGGVGAYVGGKFVPGGGVAHASGITELARSKAPPSRAESGGGLGMGCVGLILGIVVLAFMHVPEGVFSLFAWLGGLGWIVAYVRAARADQKYNRDRYPEMLEGWRRSFHCHRCGHDFIT